MNHSAAHHHVCPWWIGYLLTCPIRRWFTDPARALARYVQPGATVLEPGPGMGFFTLELARMAGPSGRVVAVDIAPRMIEGLKRRAAKAGLLDRIEARQAQPDSLGCDDLAGKTDFVLAFAMVHEMPDAAMFFAQAARAMKPGALMLLAEPPSVVGKQAFDTELKQAAAAGLELVERPRIGRNRTALLSKHP